MSARKVEVYNKNPNFIQKTINIGRTIIRLDNQQDLEDNAEYFTRSEFLMLEQSFTEIFIWDTSTWEERRILAPIVDTFYDKNNCPVIVYPYFEPLISEQEAFRIEEDEMIERLSELLREKGMDEMKIGNFINDVLLLCEKYGIDEQDILYNLNNIGWNPTFGIRIIDYGLTQEGSARYING